MSDAIPVLGLSDTQIARVALGRMIQALRKQRGLNGQQLGLALGWSQSKMSKIESGAAVIDDIELSRLIKELGASERQANQLTYQLALTGLDPLSTAFSIAHGVERRQREISQYERIAQTIDQYGHSVVPGLLQVPDYTRELLASFGVASQNIERAVEERLARQRILSQTLRQFHFIVTEAVLYTRPGGIQVQVEQLTMLRMQATHRHIRIGIIPTARGTLPRALSGFVVFNSHFVTTETVVVEQQFTDPSDVKTYVDLHNALSAIASYDFEADDLIRRAITTLESRTASLDPKRDTAKGRSVPAP